MQQFSLEIQLIHRKPPAKKVKCILKRGVPILHTHFLGFPKDPPMSFWEHSVWE